MNPLQWQIALGEQDRRLLVIIEDLTHMEQTSARGLSDGEKETLHQAWYRLEMITDPRR